MLAKLFPHLHIFVHASKEKVQSVSFLLYFLTSPYMWTAEPCDMESVKTSPGIKKGGLDGFVIPFHKHFIWFKLNGVGDGVSLKVTSVLQSQDL